MKTAEKLTEYIATDYSSRKKKPINADLTAFLRARAVGIDINVPNSRISFSSMFLFYESAMCMIHTIWRLTAEKNSGLFLISRIHQIVRTALRVIMDETVLVRNAYNYIFLVRLMANFRFNRSSNRLRPRAHSRRRIRGKWTPRKMADLEDKKSTWQKKKK